nr:MAG TPA: hypothetical protein [Caudoviricetes sp.]
MHLLFLMFLFLTVRKFAVLDRLNLASRKLVDENLTADPDRFANCRLMDTNGISCFYLANFVDILGE